MLPDPKDRLQSPLPSETVSNAHAAGDGALERDIDPLEAGTDDNELRAEDQDHTPY